MAKQEYINHTGAKKVYMDPNSKESKEELISKMAEYLQKTSDKILQYDPELIINEREDLTYVEDGKRMWNTDRVRKLVPFEMYTVEVLLSKRDERQKIMNQMYNQNKDK